MTAEKPGTPACPIVGTSGSSSERAALVTASAFNVPARTCSSTGRIDRNIIATWPPRRSVMAGPLPLEGVGGGADAAGLVDRAGGGGPTPPGPDARAGRVARPPGLGVEFATAPTRGRGSAPSPHAQ